MRGWGGGEGASSGSHFTDRDKSLFELSAFRWGARDGGVVRSPHHARAPESVSFMRKGGSDKKLDCADCRSNLSIFVHFLTT